MPNGDALEDGEGRGPAIAGPRDLGGTIESLRIASFNTHWGVTLADKPFDVVEACVALNPDILVLQESWRPNAQPGYASEIAQRLGMTLHELPMMSDRNSARPRGLALPPGEVGDCGLAVLTTLPVIDRININLGHAPGDAIKDRFGLALTIALPSGARATIAGVHASHRLWGSLPQLRRLHNAINEIGGPSAIVGDCNMWGPAIAPVLRARRRAVKGRTWPASRPHSQIDHIWIDRHWRVLSASVEPNVGSDHRPIKAEIQLREDSP
ncbi:unannotated protein [freshwater metagenome]|uniref:Unannotated protein n=1 Tax=freshwater metagenome TaxID=449393 RepID=A0A6J6KZ57_9ZZZZ|nr:hypothetical protein [Actinomycetota bacterium]